MKKIGLVVSLFIFLFIFVGCEKSPPKSSYDWVEYSKDEFGVSFYKKVTIDKNNGNYIVQVWDRKVLNDKGREKMILNLIKKGLSTEESGKKTEKIELLSFQDCKQKRRKMLFIFIRDKDDNVLYSGNSPSGFDWIEVTPDSYEEELLRTVCE